MILSFQGADAFIWIRNSKSLPDLHTAVLESVLLISGSIASFGTRLESEHPNTYLWTQSLVQKRRHRLRKHVHQLSVHILLLESFGVS